jgi:uncharacterized protein (UPF0332 family)
MQHKELMIQHSIRKADETLIEAEKNMGISLSLVQNRNYYAVFYIVLALAYMDDFSTGKHHQLMGWFNREYIYKHKIFNAELKDIYQSLFADRQKFDYIVTESPTQEQVEKSFEDAKFFVKTVKDYILKKMN